MKNNQKYNPGRRKFVGATASFMAGMAITPSVFGAPNIIRNYNRSLSIINGVTIGVITYSFRAMPDQSAEATLQYIIDAGMSATELMGDPVESFAGKPESSIDRRAFYGLMRAEREDDLTDNQKRELKEMRAQIEAYNKEVAAWRENVSMEKFKEAGRMFKDKGVSIYAFKPNAFGVANSDAEIDYGMRAARALGASHVTVELPGDDAQTLRLGKFARKNKVYMAYHGHEQQTPVFWDTALEQSAYNAMNLDLGHYIAAGNTDAIELIRNKHDRIASMHVKDRKNPAHGKDNVPWGEGDTPIKEVLRLMRDEKYDFPATVEMEYDVPQGSDPVKEVAKCLDYCAEALT